MLRAGTGSVLVLGLVLWCAVAEAATTLSGGALSGAQTWSLGNSPYLVQGDITVPSGSSLSIEPGVEVRFSTGDSQAAGLDHNRIELSIEGSLRAEGTAAAPIIFHPQSDSNALSWHGVVIQATASAASLKHVVIEGADNGLTNLAPGTVLVLTDSALRHNVAGLWLSAGSPQFDALELSDNSADGLYVLANTASIAFSLRNSVARSNGSYGVYLSAALGNAASGTLSNCTLYGNDSSGLTGQASGSGSMVSATLTSSIVSSNGITGIDGSANNDGVVTISTSYSNVFGNGLDYSNTSPGVACVSLDPKFVMPPADLRLSSASPCIASGEQGADMGAYRYDPSVTAVDSAGAAGSADSASAGQSGAAQGGAAQGGAAGEATAASEGGAAGSESAEPAGDGSGCSCRLSRKARPPALWLALPALLLLRRRSRRVGRRSGAFRPQRRQRCARVRRRSRTGR